MFKLKTIDLPTKLKRGGITELDRKMVYASVEGGTHRILFSNAVAQQRYIADVYYQSNIALRIMSRLLEKRSFTGAELNDGAIAKHIEGIARNGWVNSFTNIVGSNPDHTLAQCQRLVFKCYRYTRDSGDAFNTMHLIKSFCIEVVGVHEAQLKTYLEAGVKWRKNSEREDLYSVAQLLETKAFKALARETAGQWFNYAEQFCTSDDCLSTNEYLLAIRDHANDLVEELGEDYNFLTKACKELLL